MYIYIYLHAVTIYTSATNCRECRMANYIYTIEPDQSTHPTRWIVAYIWGLQCSNYTLRFPLSLDQSYPTFSKPIRLMWLFKTSFLAHITSWNYIIFILMLQWITIASAHHLHSSHSTIFFISLSLVTPNILKYRNENRFCLFVLIANLLPTPNFCLLLK